MPKVNPITIPKSVFLDLHPEEARVFREIVLSPAFKLAMSAAMAQFMASMPTHDQCQGAMLFRQVFESIGEVAGQQVVARGKPLSQDGRTPSTMPPFGPAPSTAPTHPAIPTPPNPKKNQ